MWYAYKGEWAKWHLLSNEQANEIIRMNKEEVSVVSLEEFALDLPPKTEEKAFENVVGQDSLNRFDRPKRKKGNFRKKKNRNRNRKASQKND